MTTSKPGERAPGQRTTQEERDYFYKQVNLGNNPYLVGSSMGVKRGVVRRLLLARAEEFQRHPAEQLSALEVALRMANRSVSIGEDGEVAFPDPIRDFDLLNDQAQRAHNEFGYHRRRYFNRRHILWQLEMVQILMAWWETGQAIKGTDESGVIKGVLNTPPGGGKTTTITHDFPIWVMGRNRDIRIAVGARTSNQSIKYSRRMRNTVQKNALLNLEFGRFKPLAPETWRVDEFIIDGAIGHPASMDYKLSLAGFNPEDPHIKKRLEDPDDDIHGVLASLADVFTTAEKEATVAALSQEMGFLGGRYDLNLWDDLCDKKNSKTPEQREDLSENFWFPEAESRCEPGGIVALIGTRFGKYDLFGHCKNLEYIDEDLVEAETIKATHSGMSDEDMAAIRDDIEKELVDRHGKPYAELATPSLGKVEGTRKVYHYYSFPAHNDRTCENPDSMKNSDHIDCILDPKRFSFRHLMQVKASNPRRFDIVYQQKDETTEDNLVQNVWLTGGSGKDGIIYPGCLNYKRRLWELPVDEHGEELLSKEDCFSIATVDPSARNFWSIQWWLYDAVNDKDYLMALLRARLTSGKFLDWTQAKGQYEGVVEVWQNRSQQMGWPIGLWIVEQNAAQRYLFQYKWVHEWMKRRRTKIKGHETHRNKADEEFGIETLAGRYMHGLTDLPYHQGDLRTKVTIDEFRQELLEYPDSPTDDMVAGHWFLHFNRQNLPSTLRVSNAHQKKSHPYSDSMPDDMDEGNPRIILPKRRGVGHREKQRSIRDGF